MKTKRITAILTAIFMMLMFTTVSADNISQIIGDGNTVVFIDVPTGHWAKDQIDYFAQQGIIDGYTDGSFKPEAGVTREEFCKLLVATFNQALETPNTPTFADVPEDRWSYPYVEVCREFLTGYANPFGGMPSFHPTEYATREDIAVALVRMMGFTDNDANNPNYAAYNFTDGWNISPNLLAYVSIACEKGLISGYPDGTFGPAKGITRAETVVLLNRATKQAVTNINAELEMSASVLYSQDGKTATVNIVAEEGTTVTVNGEAVKMSSNYYGEYEGNYVYKFEEEGSKDFIVEGKRGGKTKTVNVTAKYEVGAPTLIITECPTVSDKVSVRIGGIVSDANTESRNIRVMVNGSEVDQVSSDGSWVKDISLKEGENTITIVATNLLGKSTTEIRKINFGVGAPTLNITSCPTVSDKAKISISGAVADKNTSARNINVTINGSSVYVNGDGSWNSDISLKEGENTITIVATNSLGKSTTETKTITFNVGSPEISFTNCPEVTQQKNLSIQGKIKGQNDGAKLYINDQEVSVGYSGDFSKSVTLNDGDNSFVFRAVNSYGKSKTVSRIIKYVAEIKTPELFVDEIPSTTDESEVVITGTVNDSLDSKAIVYVNDKKITSGNGDWSATVSLEEGSNDIIIVATNSYGKSTTVVKKIVYSVTNAEEEE